MENLIFSLVRRNTKRKISNASFILAKSLFLLCYGNWKSTQKREGRKESCWKWTEPKKKSEKFPLPAKLLQWNVKFCGGKINTQKSYWWWEINEKTFLCAFFVAIRIANFHSLFSIISVRKTSVKPAHILSENEVTRIVLQAKTRLESQEMKASCSALIHYNFSLFSELIQIKSLRRFFFLARPQTSFECWLFNSRLTISFIS